MTEKKNISGKISELRMRAEQRVAQSRENTAVLSSEEMQNLLHELRVHQAELDMQNDELLNSQMRTEEALARYFDLYDLAPVGYCTICENGLITEANLSASNILGVFRNALIGRLFASFIFQDDQDIFYRYRKNLSENNEPKSFDLRMLRKDGTVFWAHLISTVSQYQDKSGQSAGITYVCRIILSDITELRREEEVKSFLAKTSGALADESFFNSLARYLAEVLNMDFVCIDRLEGDGLNARTLAVWCDGHFEDNVTYALKDTPCGDVVGKTVCCFPASVCQFFPKDQVLKDLRAESYVGVTLWSHTGQPIGLIAVIGRSPLKNRPLDETTLKMVAVRAASEIERLDVETELLLSERELADAQSLAHVGDWHVTFKEGVDVWRGSDEICRIYGYPQGIRWTMQTILERVHPDDREPLRDIWASCLRREGPAEWEHRIVADGLVKWVHVKAKFRFDETGRPIEASGIDLDITERKKSEIAIFDVEKRFRLLFEQSPEGIIVIDPQNGKFLEFNETAHRQLGYSREEFSRLRISDIEVAETNEETLLRITKVMREGRDDFETKHRTKQGDIRNILVTAQFTEMMGCHVYHCLWRDITERKLAKQAVEEKIDELQRFQKLTVGRELAMIELKKEINGLLKKSGQEEKYRIVG